MKSLSLLHKSACACLLFASAATVHASGFYAGLGAGVSEFSTNLFGMEFNSHKGIITGEGGYLWSSHSNTPWFMGPAINATYYSLFDEEIDEDDYDESYVMLLRGDMTFGKYLSESFSLQARLGALTDQEFDGAAVTGGVGAGFNVDEHIRFVAEVISAGSPLSSVTNYTLMLQYHF